MSFILDTYLRFFIFLLSFLVPPAERPGGGDGTAVAPASHADSLFEAGRACLHRLAFDSAFHIFVESAAAYKKDQRFERYIKSKIYQADCQRVLKLYSNAELILEEIEGDPAIILYKDDLLYADILKSKAQLQCDIGKYNKCDTIITQAIKIAQRWKKTSDSIMLDYYHIKGLVQYNLGYNNDAINTFKEYLEIKASKNKPYDVDLINIYTILALLYERMNETYKSLQYYDSALIMNTRLSKVDTNYFHILATYVCNLYAKIGAFKEALNRLNVFEMFINKSSKPSSILLSKLFFSKGYVYQKMGDFERAETFFLNSKEIFESHNKEINDHLANIYYSIANIKYEKELFKDALYYFTKSQNYFSISSIDIGNCYNGMASCYFLLGDTLKADIFYNKALNTKINNPSLPKYLLAYDYISYSVFLFKTNNPKQGFRFAQKALEIFRDKFGEKAPSVSTCYNWLGNFYLGTGQPGKALEYYQRAIISATDDFSSREPEVNPVLDGNYYGPELLSALKHKAAAFDSLYRREGSTENLKRSVATYDLAVRLIHKLRTSFPEMKSKLLVTGNQNETYLGAVETAVELYRQTGDAQYKAKAFETAEKGRAAVLLGSLKEQHAMNFGGVPDSLVSRENELSRNIEALQNMITEEKQKPWQNPNVIRELEGKIFGIRNQQNDLKSRFEKDYPQYYALKYDDRVMSVGTIQKRISPKDALLEYVVTRDRILIFVVTKERFELIPVSRTEPFDEDLQAVNSYLREINFFGQEREVYARYLQASRGLCSVLIDPCKRLIRDKNLIIVPDDLLASLPFEVLLTEPADPYAEFGTLPYLIQRHAIGYGYSSNLLFFNVRRFIPENIRLAAFAPDYAEASRGMKEITGLKPLMYAREEVQAAGGFFHGRIYSGTRATEENFKKVASRYDVLHLAMHAVMDDDNPLESKLVFTREANDREDGYLNTYELFNLKLRAKMAVLSACNTGAGVLQKGEGIMSLARGFYYAGCPDVVMTLWPVEDKMSTRLITDFYTYLSQGMNKIEALRLAKLNLISSSDPLRSHPYFWAGYVNIGDVTPLVHAQKKKPTGTLWAIIIGAGLLLAFPFIWKRIR